MSHEAVQQLHERIRHDQAFRYQLMADPHSMLAAYDLTEEEKQQFVLPNFSWILPHKLAGMARPYSEDALAALKAQGIRAVLSLTEEPLSKELLAQYNLQVEHVPVSDFTAPTLAQIEQAVATIDTSLAQDLPIVVHCGAGLGRTGTVLACYLVSQGTPAETAITSIRTQRPGSIETPEQEALIIHYAQQRQHPG